MKRKKRGPRAIAELVGDLTQPVFGRRGFSASAILTDWPSIVGQALSDHTCPEKIIFPERKKRDGSLELRVDHGSLATELIHLEPLLIERINRYFGFRAIARLKIIQGPLPEKKIPAKPQQRTLAPDRETDLANDLASVDDPELREALGRLGRAVMAREKPAGKA
ncbi:MAG: DciA family protein [Rhodospirillales bacterium]|nr:DciA family protein [Rhodospirillales bacterium]MCW9002548.1 DciA family protein [Rhodospirillales bacterium]MCW9040367.1 DciA family protein [Rhodospirillales bacterium]